MASQDGRPYRKASEYRAQRQVMKDASATGRTTQSLESENEQLRERLAGAERKLETMEVEYDQSREYFVEQLEITKLKLREKVESLTVMQRNYSELQAMLYELQEKNSKVFEIERDRDQLILALEKSDDKVEELGKAVRKLKEDNERLRHECKLAVSLLQCNQGDMKHQPVGQSNMRPGNFDHNQVRVDPSQYNEHVNPYMDDSDDNEPAYQAPGYGYNRSNLDRKFGRQPGPVAKNPPKNTPAERKSPIFKKMRESPETTEPERTNTQSKATTRSSPWELQDSTNTRQTTQSSQSSTPWVRDPSQIQDFKPLPFNQIGYRYSSAGAYGATPIVYPKSKPMPQKLEEKPIMTGNVRVAEKKFIPARRSNKGIGENKDVYIADDNSSAMVGSSPFQHANSSESSRKSTPNRVPTAVERGSSAEKSSLLEMNDDEDVIMTIEQDTRTGTKFGMKSAYKSQSSEVEGRGLLRRESDSEQEQEERTVIQKDSVQYLADSDEDDEVTNEDKTENVKMREAIVHEESVMHEEMNLMTMSEAIAPVPRQPNSVLNDLLLADTEVTSHAMLADIPPPNMDVIATDTILGAPPPPPMFMGNPPPMASHPYPPPYNHPMPYSSSAARFPQPFMMPQSSPMTSQPYSMMSQPPRMSRSPMMSQPPRMSQSPMMSQPPPMRQKQEAIVTSPSNALDNLTSVIQKEFESAQSPKKSVSAMQDDKVVDTPSNGDDITAPPRGVVDSSVEPTESSTQPSTEQNDSDRCESAASEPSDMKTSSLHADPTIESKEDTLIGASSTSPVLNLPGEEQNLEIASEDVPIEPPEVVHDQMQASHDPEGGTQSPTGSPELLV